MATTGGHSPPLRHPPYKQMIMAAVGALQRENGGRKAASRRAIAKHLAAAHSGTLSNRHGALLSRNLASLTSSGLLLRVGYSYQLPPPLSPGNPVAPPGRGRGRGGGRGRGSSSGSRPVPAAESSPPVLVFPRNVRPPGPPQGAGAAPPHVVAAAGGTTPPRSRGRGWRRDGPPRSAKVAASTSTPARGEGTAAGDGGEVRRGRGRPRGRSRRRGRRPVPGASSSDWDATIAFGSAGSGLKQRAIQQSPPPQPQPPPESFPPDVIERMKMCRDRFQRKSSSAEDEEADICACVEMLKTLSDFPPELFYSAISLFSVVSNRRMFKGIRGDQYKVGWILHQLSS